MLTRPPMKNDFRVSNFQTFFQRVNQTPYEKLFSQAHFGQNKIFKQSLWPSVLTKSLWIFVSQNQFFTLLIQYEGRCDVDILPLLWWWKMWCRYGGGRCGVGGYDGDGGGGGDILNEQTFIAFPSLLRVIFRMYCARWDKKITITIGTESLFSILVQDNIFHDCTHVYFSIIKFLRTFTCWALGVPRYMNILHGQGFTHSRGNERKWSVIWLLTSPYNRLPLP